MWLRNYTVLFFLITLIVSECSGAKKCQPKNLGFDSVVCVCNETYCDELEPIKPKNNEFVVITTSKGGHRFEKRHGTFESTFFSTLISNLINTNTPKPTTSTPSSTTKLFSPFVTATTKTNKRKRDLTEPIITSIYDQITPVFPYNQNTTTSSFTKRIPFISGSWKPIVNPIPIVSPVNINTMTTEKSSDRTLMACNGTGCYEMESSLSNGEEDATVETADDVLKQTSNDYSGSSEVKESTEWDWLLGGTIAIQINPMIKYQTIMGFGAAMTDAAAINIMSLPLKAQDNLLKSAFSMNGNQYNFVRLTMGMCDFSTHPYTYDDVTNDMNLTYFNLTEEDYSYKIPLLQRAKALSPYPFKIMSTPWSAPAWMKSGGHLLTGAPLRREFYQIWANYFVKFMKAYKAVGLPISFTTVQNEPTLDSGDLLHVLPLPTMMYTGSDEADFIRILGNTLGANGLQDVQILAGDDNYSLSTLALLETIFNDASAPTYTSGIAMHGYYDFFYDYSQLKVLQNKIGTRYIMYTEFCVGIKPFFPHVELGSWDHATDYITEIIKVLIHGAHGFLDWNLALDMQGGPNFMTWYVDGTIIVNKDAAEFYKQPSFYAMGHLSKFVPPGSVRIDNHMVSGSSDILSVAFLTPENNTVVVIYNPEVFKRAVEIRDVFKGSAWISAPPYSINTVVYAN